MRGAAEMAFEAIPCVGTPTSVEEVDDSGYLAANPDVQRVGMSAREHFTKHGAREGRLQWINEAQVTRLRDRKLARLRFKGAPPSRVAGTAPDWISPDHRAAFGIPEAPPISSNEYGGHVVDLIRDNPDKLFLDVGAGLRKVYFSNVVYTEIYSSICTDVVCLGEDLPFESDQFDYVFSFAVLEHTMRPWDVAREMCRVLKPGGKIWVDYPFLQPVHGYPHHYFNATPRGNASLFEPYCEIDTLEVFQNNHPIQALTWMLRLWSNGLPAAAAARFGDLRVADLLGMAADDQMASAYCRDLDEPTRRTIAAGSGLIATRRPMPIPDTEAARGEDARRESAALHAAIGVIRASTSWRITAPTRALGRGLARLLGR